MPPARLGPRSPAGSGAPPRDPTRRTGRTSPSRPGTLDTGSTAAAAASPRRIPTAPAEPGRSRRLCTCAARSRGRMPARPRSGVFSLILRHPLTEDRGEQLLADFGREHPEERIRRHGALLVEDGALLLGERHLVAVSVAEVLDA